MAVIRRADWGAGPHRAGTIPLPVPRLFLHHSVTPFWVGAQAARNLQAIARARGFLDISYSWLADRQGNEIEGRGWGRSGAHTRGFNTTSHALCGVGNMEANVMPDGMVRSHVRLVRRHGAVGPRRITHVHSDVAATACPGRHSRSRVAGINAAAITSTPIPEPEDDDMKAIELIADGRAVTLIVGGGTIPFDTNVRRTAVRKVFSSLDIKTVRTDRATFDWITSRLNQTRDFRKLAKLFDAEAIAGAVAAELSGRAPGDITVQEIETALRRVFADAANET